MSALPVSGHVHRREGKRGAVWYARLRLPDGRHVARLFARARSAGISLLLGTQELADLKTAADGLKDQVLGNLDALIAHRQNVPESAELIAAMAGTKPAWATIGQTTYEWLGSGPSGRGSRRRGYEFRLHPSRLKTLGAGEAAVICPASGQLPVVARIFGGDERARHR